MAHQQQYNYIQKLKTLSDIFLIKVLEVGSLNINGSIRVLFTEL